MRKTIIDLQINPVDPSQAVALPPPWPDLQEAGFHSDLLERARGFMLVAERDGFSETARGVLTLIGNGFARRFDLQQFKPAADDPDFELKQRYLAAIAELSNEFGDRVSTVVWDTLAFLGSRPNPRESATIPSQQQYLTLPWPMADAALHALPKVFGLNLHVLSHICGQTGMVLEHNCDCSHSLRKPLQGTISCFLDPSGFREATAALLSHLFSEAVLIYHLKLPFNLGVSTEALEAASLQAT